MECQYVRVLGHAKPQVVLGWYTMRPREDEEKPSLVGHTWREIQLRTVDDWRCGPTIRHGTSSTVTHGQGRARLMVGKTFVNTWGGGGDQTEWKNSKWMDVGSH